MTSDHRRNPIPLIDSHAHLDFDRFDEDRDAVLERAQAAGVERILSIGTQLNSSRAALALAEAYPFIYSSAGVHPLAVGDFEDEEWDELAQLWHQPKVLAVGETGLDYYYDTDHQERQRSLFRRHIEVAGEVGLPLVIHVRDAFDDAFSLLEEVGTPAGGVLHCFTGGIKECERALGLGLHISLSGIATFKNAKGLREAIPHIPGDRILVETDAPYLAPVPNRGQRNEPAFVVHTANEVARLRGETYADLCAQTRANTYRLFKMS